MVEFGSLGSVNDFAERTGRDPKSRETLERFGAALAVAHRIDRSLIYAQETGPESITKAHFVTKVGPDSIVGSRTFDGNGKAHDTNNWDIEDLVGAGADAAEITEGDMFWLTLTRDYNLEVDGGSFHRWTVESLDLPPAPLQ